jgi:hypothetical protein
VTALAATNGYDVDHIAAGDITLMKHLERFLFFEKLGDLLISFNYVQRRQRRR